MLPELPDPFPGDTSVGFSVTVQIFSGSSEDLPVLSKAWLRESGVKDVPIYTVTPGVIRVRLEVYHEVIFSIWVSQDGFLRRSFTELPAASPLHELLLYLKDVNVLALAVEPIEK